MVRGVFVFLQELAGMPCSSLRPHEHLTALMKHRWYCSDVGITVTHNQISNTGVYIEHFFLQFWIASFRIYLTMPTNKLSVFFQKSLRYVGQFLLVFAEDGATLAVQSAEGLTETLPPYLGVALQRTIGRGHSMTSCTRLHSRQPQRLLPQLEVCGYSTDVRCQRSSCAETWMKNAHFFF